MIKGCVQFRSSPDVSMRVDLTPIDYVASVIVQLSLMPNCIGNDFHPVSESAYLGSANQIRPHCGLRRGDVALQTMARRAR